MDLDTETKSKKLCLEDILVGQIFRSGTHQIDADSIKTFASSFDPQPFHLDEDAAKETFFEGLAASGWHTAAITMNLLVSSIPIKGGLIGAGGELSWPRATRPGDTLKVETEVLDIKPSRSRPDRGIVTVRSTTLNQDGKAVQILTSRMVVFSRQSSARNTSSK